MWVFLKKNNFEFHTVVYCKIGILLMLYNQKHDRPFGWCSGHFRVNRVFSW